MIHNAMPSASFLRITFPRSAVAGSLLMPAILHELSVGGPHPPNESGNGV